MGHDDKRSSALTLGGRTNIRRGHTNIRRGHTLLNKATKGSLKQLTCAATNSGVYVGKEDQNGPRWLEIPRLDLGGHTYMYVRKAVKEVKRPFGNSLALALALAPPLAHGARW